MVVDQVISWLHTEDLDDYLVPDLIMVGKVDFKVSHVHFILELYIIDLMKVMS